jgi:hypothetical protein
VVCTRERSSEVMLKRREAFANVQMRKRVDEGERMLRLLAVETHVKQKSVFTGAEACHALQNDAAMLKLWSQSTAAGGTFPLIQVISRDSSGDSVFEFQHGGFQEALFASALKEGAVPGFWDDDAKLTSRLEDPYFWCSLDVGRGNLLEAIDRARDGRPFHFRLQRNDPAGSPLRDAFATSIKPAPQLLELDLTGCDPGITVADHAWLARVAEDFPALRRLDVGAGAGVAALALLCTSHASAAKLDLRVEGQSCALVESLHLGNTSLPAEVGVGLGRLLRGASGNGGQRLEGLWLEDNHKLGSAAFFRGFAGALGSAGLPSLQRLGMTHCGIRPGAEEELNNLLRLCPQIKVVYLGGNPILQHPQPEIAAPRILW